MENIRGRILLEEGYHYRVNIILQGPHDVAGQAFLSLPSKQMKISKNGIKYLSKMNNLAPKVINDIFMSIERVR